MAITYTTTVEDRNTLAKLAKVAADTIPATLTGGIVKSGGLVQFAEKINRQHITLRIASRPALAAAVEAAKKPVSLSEQRAALATAAAIEAKCYAAAHGDAVESFGQGAAAKPVSATSYEAAAAALAAFDAAHPEVIAKEQAEQLEAAEKAALL